VGLCLIVAWLSLDYGILRFNDAASPVPSVHLGQSSPIHSGAGALAGLASPQPDAIASNPLLTAGTMERYAAMLRDLDVGMADLFDLQVRTNVIDPGHGGRDPGAVGPGAVKEKDVVLDIARRLRDKLMAASPHRVLLTREDDSLVPLKDRVAFAAGSQADLFISIHINSVPAEAGPVNYVETYYFGPHADQRTLDLAQQENHGSDYRIGDFRSMIARIGDRLKTEESARLASAIHHQLYDRLRHHSEGLQDAGVKSGPFVVLLGVEVPSVLVEIACISNEAEARRLSTPDYRDSVAGYLQAGVSAYLQDRAARPTPSEVRTPYVAQQEG
jgi:N-acetylmuramoyl-L-alanine amidase